MAAVLTSLKSHNSDFDLDSSYLKSNMFKHLLKHCENVHKWFYIKCINKDSIEKSSSIVDFFFFQRNTIFRYTVSETVTACFAFQQLYCAQRPLCWSTGRHQTRPWVMLKHSQGSPPAANSMGWEMLLPVHQTDPESAQHPSLVYFYSWGGQLNKYTRLKTKICFPVQKIK